MIKATLGVLLLVMSSTLAMAQKTTSFFSSSGSFAGSSIKCSDRSTSVYSKDGSFAGLSQRRLATPSLPSLGNSSVGAEIISAER
jgi:hypothetical protein